MPCAQPLWPRVSEWSRPERPRPTSAWLAEVFLGTYPLPMKPSEYLARNVRATPLNGGNDSPLVRIMDDLPEDMIVFSSDFPHFEGFTEPAKHYADLLAPLDDARRARFLGGTIADVYRRMGDPLTLPNA